jgi:hypothetical protein
VGTTASMRSASDHTLPPAGAAAVLCHGTGLPGCTYRTQTQLQHMVPCLLPSTIGRHSVKSKQQTAVRCAALLALIPHLAIGEQDATGCCCCCCCQVAGRCLLPHLAAWVCYGHPLWACSMQPPAQQCTPHRSCAIPCAPTFSRCYCFFLHIADSCRKELQRRGGGRCCYIAKMFMLLDSTLEALVGSVHMPADSVCALPRGSVPLLCLCC